MPKFKVPVEHYGMAMPSAESKGHKPTVYMPIDPKWVSKFEVGKKVEITLKGKVQMVESQKEEKDTKATLRVELDTIELPYDNEYSDLAKDDEDDE